MDFQALVKSEEGFYKDKTLPSFYNNSGVNDKQRLLKRLCTPIMQDSAYTSGFKYRRKKYVVLSNDFFHKLLNSLAAHEKKVGK